MQRAKRLYVLDYGLFQVNENDRIIGLVGYLIQTYDGTNILVDTGFPAWYADDVEKASAADNLHRFGHILQLDHENLPHGQLAQIGLNNEDIDILVMTHTDIDHVGGMNEFPDARFVISRAERELPQPRYFGERSAIPWPSNVETQLIDEDTDLCAGVRLLCTPGHAPGQLSLLVHLPETGSVLLTGDAISRPAEVDEGFVGAWDPTLAGASAKRLMDIAEQEQAWIVYGHDPVQWDQLKKAPAFYG